LKGLPYNYLSPPLAASGSESLRLGEEGITGRGREFYGQSQKKKMGKLLETITLATWN
jgi:hypothetical protein